MTNKSVILTTEVLLIIRMIHVRMQRLLENVMSVEQIRN